MLRNVSDYMETVKYNKSGALSIGCKIRTIEGNFTLIKLSYSTFKMFTTVP